MNNNAKNRKRTALAAGFAALALGSFANVGVFNGAGQTPVVEKTDAVQMVEEEVVMTPRAAKGPVTTNCANLDPMDYRCTFRLRNLRDEPVKLQVGFPLEYAPFRPEPRDAITLGFVAPPMPTEPGDVDVLESIVRQYVAKSGKDLNEKQFVRDAKDVVLEFYGVKMGNARIASFLEEQCWWGQKHPISEALKQRLSE